MHSEPGVGLPRAAGLAGVGEKPRWTDGRSQGHPQPATATASGASRGGVDPLVLDWGKTHQALKCA